MCSSRCLHYLALQFSAIQKTVLRHDRLWSIAGLSFLLSELNEVILPSITAKKKGRVLVAGGGKFTASFEEERNALEARAEIVKLISTSLPMLEFQCSQIRCGRNLHEVRDALIEELSFQKRKFRGYAVSYNPHFEVCAECGEYPAVRGLKTPDRKSLCSICYQAKKSLRRFETGQPSSKSNTIQKIYEKYLQKIAGHENGFSSQLIPNIPIDFKDLFPGDKESEKGRERKRMALWSSDTNNMNQKVPIWFSQNDEKITEIFKRIKDLGINIISTTLGRVFPPSTWIENGDPENPEKEYYLPFRIIVAGGDDLCVVMPEKYVLSFAIELSRQVTREMERLDKNDPLHPEWLEKNRNPEKAKIHFAPYSFGSSFVIAPIHTPFSKIHEIGEILMSSAKSETRRQANSVNWQILGADEGQIEENSILLEKPVFIEKQRHYNNGGNHRAIPDRLSLEEYRSLRKFYLQYITNSQKQKIASLLITYHNHPRTLEKELIKRSTRRLEKGCRFLLVDPIFRKDKNLDNELDPKKIGALLALMSMKDVE